MGYTMIQDNGADRLSEMGGIGGLFFAICRRFPNCTCSAKTLMKAAHIKNKDTFYKHLNALEKLEVIKRTKGITNVKPATITKGKALERYWQSDPIIEPESDPIIEPESDPIIEPESDPIIGTISSTKEEAVQKKSNTKEKKGFFGRACDYLETIINANRPKHKPIKVDVDLWINEMKKLIDNKTTTKTELKEVLMWTKLNATNKYTPKIKSIDDFLEKYEKLINAMERSGTKPIKISEVAKKINLDLSTQWPTNAKDQVLATIQISLNYDVALISYLNKYQEKNDHTNILCRAAKNYSLSIRSINSHILIWMRELQNYVNSIPDWKGNLRDFAFSKTNKKALQCCRDITKAYTGNSSHWDKIMKGFDK